MGLPWGGVGSLVVLPPHDANSAAANNATSASLRYRAIPPRLYSIAWPTMILQPIMIFHYDQIVGPEYDPIDRRLR